MPGSIELEEARAGRGTGAHGRGHGVVLRGAKRARDRDGDAPESALGDVPAKLREAGVTLELGGHTEKTFLEQDLIIPSPGVPADDHSDGGASQKITIWSEIELAYRFLEGRLIGITGSNGKTTTTSLVHTFWRSRGSRRFSPGMSARR